MYSSTVEVEGTRPRGRPKKTLTDVVKDDMRRLVQATEDAQDRGKWRRVIGGSRPTGVYLDKQSLKTLCVCVIDEQYLLENRVTSSELGFAKS